MLELVNTFFTYFDHGDSSGVDSACAQYSTVARSDRIGTMFKRSFHSKDRAGKAVKPVKKSYREYAKMKLQQKFDSPPVGR